MDSVHEEIRIAAESMDATEPDPTNVEGIRTRRMAPLGIVGSLSKSLFGLITEDDAELINKSIDRLFHDQSALVKLSEETTHLLSAGLEELYNISASQSLLLKEMRGQLTEKINSMTQEMNKNILWELNISRVARHLKRLNEPQTPCPITTEKNTSSYLC